MKTFIVSVLVMASLHVYAQGNIQFALAVLQVNNKPAPGITVNAIETTSLKQVTAKTGVDGKVVLQLKDGKEWAISIGEVKKCMYAVSNPGRMVSTSRVFVYDPKDYKRKQQQDHKRSNEKFKLVQQSVEENARIKPGECYLAVRIQRPEGTPIPGTVVSAVNVKDSVIYQSTTNARGLAFFILPNKTNYEIDLNHLKNFSYMDFGDEYRMHSLSLIFVPTEVKEKTVNDTTYQELDELAHASSERTLLKISVSGGKRNGVNERVYLRNLSSGKVYSALTNAKRDAYFLVPFKSIYMIDFRYQKDADAINLLHVNEVANWQMKVNYSPDPRLEYPETFIPTPDRLLLKSFSSFLEKQFARPPKEKPFSLELRSMKKINRTSREALFMLTLAGSENYGNVRLPLNAALVLDKSGSMFSDNRSEALKKSLLDIGTLLTEKDNVSVILFDDTALEVQQATTNYMESFRLLADNYMPGGGTNISGGLLKGAEGVQKNFDSLKSNKIILLTDGYGDNPPKDITDFVETKFKEGIEFSAIGLGNDYNQALLELIAVKGNGSFSFVDESNMLSDAFLKEIKGTLAYCAKDLSIEVYHDRRLMFSSLYGYPIKSKTAASVSFEIGKVPHNTDHIAFLKFSLDNPSQELESVPLVVKVKYFDLAKNQTVSYQQEVKLEWTEETDTELLIGQEEQRLYAIAILNQSMKLMAEAYELKNNKAAKAALKSGRDQIEEIFPDAKPKQVKELFAEVDRYLQLFIQLEKNEQSAITK